MGNRWTNPLQARRQSFEPTGGASKFISRNSCTLADGRLAWRRDAIVWPQPRDVQPH